MSNSRPFRILTIDGGGIRGIIPAVWLRRLEAELKARKTSLIKCFDLICGTSTGSIVGAAVATETDINRVIDLFRDDGPAIFRRSRLKGLVNRLMPSASGLVSARYGSEKLQEALMGVLDNTRMGDVDEKVHLCIPSYDIGNRGTFYFKSYAPNTAKTEVWRACLASSAAPTYFPAQKVSKRYFVDGGVSANNPSGVGLAEGISLLRKKSLKETQLGRGIQLISMGTGSSTRNLTQTLVGNKGAIPWASAILDVMFDGSSDVNDHIVDKILEDKAYVRLQFELKSGRGSDDLDNATDENIDELCGAAESYAEKGEGADRFEEMLSMLLPPKKKKGGGGNEGGQVVSLAPTGT